MPTSWTGRITPSTPGLTCSSGFSAPSPIRRSPAATTSFEMSFSRRRETMPSAPDRRAGGRARQASELVPELADEVGVRVGPIIGQVGWCDQQAGARYGPALDDDVRRHVVP